ncbi:MAG TPA: UDP-4-amino-4,6-dideoxy-N-acetyl-beta-L-altrosamine transaminase [Polyangiaceae bacterium]|nr:UDP-4-amino-4,6-dideoxy-N-acetyl-beta-L-altrosamine transaminase [Polyangiaceae bacterium]
MVSVLPYGRQSIDDDDVAAVVEQLRSDWLTQGPTVGRFEEALCAITGARHGVAVANGTAALHIACLAAGVRTGDVGVTSDITFVASANCVRYAGGEPSLVDVEPETGLLSVSALESRIAELGRAGRTTKVILPVDLAGSVADLPAVARVAQRAGACVIEDAAHSLGATYEHEGTTFRAASCAHSTMAILSFHPVKHITTGEGGAVMTNDDGLYRELLDLRTHGITKDPSRLEANEGPWWYEQRRLGFNYRITDLQCALGLRQARRLPAFLARRREIAARYDAAFSSGDLRLQMTPLRVPSRTRSAYHLYVVQVRARAGEGLAEVAERRRALFLHLRARGIAPQVHYIPIHRQPDFVRSGFARGDFAGAERYYAGCISLPMFPAMTDADVDRVIEAVREGAPR